MRPSTPAFAAAAVATTLMLCSCAAWTSRDPSLGEAQCHAARASSFLDRRADDETANQAMVQAGAVRRQLVPFGTATRNSDVDPQRLNIEVDPTGVIKRMRCG